MNLLNWYSLAHFIIWFTVGGSFRISWTTFLLLSLGWEALELVLPFEFAEELVGNKLTDIAVNMLAFYLGNNLRNRRQASSG